MAFVQLTWAQNGGPISVNVDHIVAVRPDDERTVLLLSPSSKDGMETRRVSEQYGEVMKRIEAAQVYGPKG